MREIIDTLFKIAHDCCIYMTLNSFARNLDLGPERSEAELGERSERGSSKTIPQGPKSKLRAKELRVMYITRLVTY